MNNNSKIKLINENGAAKEYGEIPDLWHIADQVGDRMGHAHQEAILEVWHMAHDLKAVIERQRGHNSDLPAHITEVRGVGANRLAQLDQLVRENTAFRDFFELVDAKGGYRPSLPGDETWAQILAKAYDAYQERNGDDRRAFVY